MKPDIMMGMDETDHRVAAGDKEAQPFKGKTVLLPLRLFRHRDLLTEIINAPLIKQKALINTLHHVHFTNGSLLVHVTDPTYGEDFLLHCRLESCTPEEIRCQWPEDVPPVSDKGHLRHLIVEDGLSLLLFPIQVRERDPKGFTVPLPAEGRLLGKRRIRRHLCQAVQVDLMQNGFSASGELIDFTPLAFRVRLAPPPHTSFIWMNSSEAFTVCLRKDGRFLFTGACWCVRQTGDALGRELVLAQREQSIQRFRKKKIRTPRLQVTPPPAAHLQHPLLQQPILRDIWDLTFAGFVVEEPIEACVLMPGMIIPSLEIRYAETLKMTCDAQVIYRRETKKGRVRCGMAIMNMDFKTYSRLGHIMVHSEDPYASIGTKVEMEALWEFFFDTGFIYPRKYHLLQDHREAFKETYRKLYQEEQEIAAHFTYRENGLIYGHVSMIRAYQRAWMIHHLAARPMAGRRTGLAVLKHILRFFEGLHRYPAIGMDYLLFYFRPENHFPNLFFGGFARDFNNQHGCSLDLFSYRNEPIDPHRTELPENWQLTVFSNEHLPSLEQYYRRASGGLLLNVLGFGQTIGENEPVSSVFRRHGFIREWNAHALTQHGQLKAVLIVNRSDIGISLSEFLNCVKIIVLDPDALPWEVMKIALARLTPSGANTTRPIMIYPSTYPGAGIVPVEKRYLLWIMDTQYGGEFQEYMQKKTRLTLRFLIHYLLRKLVRK